jgi:hypothetical protein
MSLWIFEGNDVGRDGVGLATIAGLIFIATSLNSFCFPN